MTVLCVLCHQVAAKKLHTWAAESNDAGEVMPIQGTCLGHQLLQILATWPANFTEILVPTVAVVCTKSPPPPPSPTLSPHI